jgi:hypothetical protein
MGADETVSRGSLLDPEVARVAPEHVVTGCGGDDLDNSEMLVLAQHERTLGILMVQPDGEPAPVGPHCLVLRARQGNARKTPGIAALAAQGEALAAAGSHTAHECDRLVRVTDEALLFGLPGRRRNAWSRIETTHDPTSRC